MLHRMAINAAQFFSANNETPFDEDDIEVYAYGVELLLASVLETFAILALGIVVGKTFETLAFFISFMPIRSYAGGYHAKTHFKCFCGVLLVYAVFLLVQFITPIWMIKSTLLIFIIVSAIPIILFAPLANSNRPIGPIDRKKFRRLSIIFYLIQAIIIVGLSITEMIPYITLGFAFGQLSASGSLVVAKVRDYYKGGELDGCKVND